MRQAADAAASAGFAPGVLSPTEIDLDAALASPRAAPSSTGSKARCAASRASPRCSGRREQPSPPAPQIMVARDANAVRLAVIFDCDPLGAPAIHKLAGAA